MAAITKLELIGADELLRKLDESLYSDAWGAAFSATVKWIYARAQKRAPVGQTGALKSNLRMVVEKSSHVPSWAYVSTNASSPKGVRYPFVLEAGHRRGKGGRDIQLHKRGKKTSTRKWLRGSLGGAKRQAMTYMLTAIKAIEERWGR